MIKNLTCAACFLETLDLRHRCARTSESCSRSSLISSSVDSPLFKISEHTSTQFGVVNYCSTSNTRLSPTLVSGLTGFFSRASCFTLVSSSSDSWCHQVLLVDEAFFFLLFFSHYLLKLSGYFPGLSSLISAVKFGRKIQFRYMCRFSNEATVNIWGRRWPCLHASVWFPLKQRGSHGPGSGRAEGPAETCPSLCRTTWERTV